MTSGPGWRLEVIFAAAEFHPRDPRHSFTYACGQRTTKSRSTPPMKPFPPPADGSYAILPAASPLSSPDRLPPVPAMMIRQGVTGEMSVVRSARSWKVYSLLKSFPLVGLSIFSLQLQLKVGFTWNRQQSRLLSSFHTCSASHTIF